MKILITDDSEESRESLRKILETEGYSIEIAGNGKEALELARLSPPDLIISDIMMPVMDGFALCRNFKKDPDLKKIPFVFYTATYTDPSDEQLALDLGACRFVRKPVNPSQFLPLINEILTAYNKGRLEHHEAPRKQYPELEESYTVRLAKKLDKKVQELKQEREGLKESEARYRALAARLRDVEEEERKKLSRELHDRCGQNLTALGINLNIIRNQLAPGVDDALRSRIDDSIALVEEIAEQVVDVMEELRPGILDLHGLVPALRWYCERFTDRTGLSTEIRGGENTPRPPAAVESALFYICQEALNNAAKHAEAGRVLLSLQHERGRLRLVIEDDGKGLDPGTDNRTRERHGWGLLIMRERAGSVGGTFDIESGPGKGTRITVEVKR